MLIWIGPLDRRKQALPLQRGCFVHILLGITLDSEFVLYITCFGSHVIMKSRVGLEGDFFVFPFGATVLALNI